MRSIKNVYNSHLYLVYLQTEKKMEHRYNFFPKIFEI